MTNPMVRIHNAETGEIIDREMTAAELTTHTSMQEQEATLQKEIEIKKIAKAELLAKLGITADEATLLLS